MQQVTFVFYLCFFTFSKLFLALLNELHKASEDSGMNILKLQPFNLLETLTEVNSPELPASMCVFSGTQEQYWGGGIFQHHNTFRRHDFDTSKSQSNFAICKI